MENACSRVYIHSVRRYAYHGFVITYIKYNRAAEDMKCSSIYK